MSINYYIYRYNIWLSIFWYSNSKIDTLLQFYIIIFLLPKPIILKQYIVGFTNNVHPRFSLIMNLF